MAGGVENMSKAPYYLRGARYGYGAGNAVLVDSNTESQPRSQPFEVYGNLTMGLTAENLAEKYGISREEQDGFALAEPGAGLRGHRVGPVQGRDRAGARCRRRRASWPSTPTSIRGETTLEALAELPAVFKEGGTVTAGNSSGRNDGAACTVVMSAKEARRRGLKPMVTIRSQAVAGVPPEIMGIGPAPASRKALAAAGLTSGRHGPHRAERSLRRPEPGRDQGARPRRPPGVNVNGGAIALGHPLGCSGARIFTTLLFEMQKRGTRYGLATLCIAGGQGIATVVEAAVQPPICDRRAGMKTHEYQAREILKGYGVPFPPASVAETAEEAEAIARELGGPWW